MNRAIRDKLLDLARDNGIDAEPYDDYSGRFMFGEKTAAIQIDRLTDAGLLEGLYIANGGKRLNLRTDNLGLGFIAY